MRERAQRAFDVYLALKFSAELGKWCWQALTSADIGGSYYTSCLGLGITIRLRRSISRKSASKFLESYPFSFGSICPSPMLSLSESSSFKKSIWERFFWEQFFRSCTVSGSWQPFERPQPIAVISAELEVGGWLISADSPLRDRRRACQRSPSHRNRETEPVDRIYQPFFPIDDR